MLFAASAAPLFILALRNKVSCIMLANVANGSIESRAPSNRVYDDAGNVIKAHEHAGDLKES